MGNSLNYRLKKASHPKANQMENQIQEYEKRVAQLQSSLSKVVYDNEQLFQHAVDTEKKLKAALKRAKKYEKLYKRTNFELDILKASQFEDSLVSSTDSPNDSKRMHRNKIDRVTFGHPCTAIELASMNQRLSMYEAVVETNQ